ncbi:MAG: hypothetical protein ABII13_03305 [Patescibacteria group bacterium]|nr:hypothetical protein [Patescibacteria group bacterium]MBU2509201.1 hypothetical protein [Patescibacteria group bacterium]
MNEIPKHTEAESKIEKEELPIGRYTITAKFIDNHGADQVMKLEFATNLQKGETLDDLKEKASGEINFTGLHNFGMDVSYKNYPDGHPVKVLLEHQSGKTIEYEQMFDGNGRPIEKK